MLSKAHLNKSPLLKTPSPIHLIKTNKPNFPFKEPLSLVNKCKGNTQFNQIQAQMTTTGLIKNPFLSSKLIDFVCSNSLPGYMRVAFQIADQTNQEDIYTWNTIIKGYLEAKNPKAALLLYAHIRRRGLSVDSYTMLYVIRACGLVSACFEGLVIHAQIFKMGFQSQIITQTALVRMFGSFDKLSYAQKVFDETPHRDLVLWNALLAAYEQRDHPLGALSVLCEMMNGNVRPNGVTLVSILSACSSLLALNEGKSVHGFVMKCLVGFDVFVCNALINMYANCGRLVEARRVFESMPSQNPVTWTSMINGYSNNKCLHEALALFTKMESANVRPDEITLLGLISMCSKLGSFELAEWIDHYIKKNGYLGNTRVANSLMDMHSKCGHIERACQVFNDIPSKTLVSWTTMIKGLAMYGHGIAALIRFSQMLREGFEPDCIVYLSILSACSHAGLVDEGRRCFNLMVEEHGLEPWKEHYGCMVDLLCRAGLVDEAFEFVKRMPIKPDGITWRTLLGAFRNSEKIGLAKQVIDHLRALEPNYSGNYVLISNLYAMAGDWDSFKEVRDEMEVKGVLKEDPACSLVEMNFSM